MSARSLVSSHVLDATSGRPAAGVDVRLVSARGAELGRARTDADGRVAGLGPAALDPGTYHLRFDSGGWFAAAGVETFYPEVLVAFTVDAARDHYHVPLLLSPFSYTTYRGS